MAVGSSIPALVASLDLSLVRLLRHAMQPKVPCATILLAPRIDPRPVIHPTPHIDPRPVIHPTPRFEPRPVIHPTPRIDAPPSPAASVPIEPRPCATKSPIQPPWKILPWHNPPPPPPKVKLLLKPPDVLVKGTIYDVFV